MIVAPITEGPKAETALCRISVLSSASYPTQCWRWDRLSSTSMHRTFVTRWPFSPLPVWGMFSASMHIGKLTLYVTSLSGVVCLEHL